MELTTLGERNLTVAFLSPFYTTTHLIFGDNRVYVCDTFIGPEPMKKISKIIKEKGHQDKPIVVFNSHADWDHVWGNCHFRDATILGHRECRTRIEKDCTKDLKKFYDQRQGEVVLIPPTTVFDTNYIFEDDDIEFFYSPGHTIDSSSCYDRKEHILFVGDNIESNIPYVNSLDFDTYISTLEGYLARDWKHVVPGHDPIQNDASLILSNIDYLKLLKEWAVNLDVLSSKALNVHLYTLSKLVSQITTAGIQEKVKSHYKDAIAVLEGMDMDNRVRDYLSLYRRITE